MRNVFSSTLTAASKYGETRRPSRCCSEPEFPQFESSDTRQRHENKQPDDGDDNHDEYLGVEVLATHQLINSFEKTGNYG